MFANALPTAVAACLVAVFVPESPRFFLCRGKLRDAVLSANLIATRIGYEHDKLLTEEELRQYLYKAQSIGMTSIRAKEAIATNDYTTTEDREENLLKEAWASLLNISQVFTNRMYRVTIPLQMTYVCLTLVTGVATWWTKIFQSLNLSTDAYSLSFYHTLAQIPGMMLASGLIDAVGRRRLVIIGFGGGSITLLMLSMFSKAVINSDKDVSSGSAIALGLACCYSICLCIGWLALDCLSAESFPTKVRSTGRGVCVATGRIAGFLVQFAYGPLINQNKLSYMLSIASVFAVGGVFMSYQTTDTTNVDLNDIWDGDKNPSTDESERPRRISFAQAGHSKYLSTQ